MAHNPSDYPEGEEGQPRTLEQQAGEGARRFSPSVGRNKKIIAEAFLDNVSATASVLEIGSGTGEHGVYITEQAPEMFWSFTENSAEAMSGISAWMAHTGREKLYGPYEVNAASEDWGEVIEAQNFDVIFMANVLHITPFEVAKGVFAGAERLLSKPGKLLIYGPFSRSGRMAMSNQRFAQDLKRRDTLWGVRDVENDLLPLAQRHGLNLSLAANMPSNNLMLVFETD